MSIIDGKKDVFVTIGSYVSLAEDIGKKARNIAQDASGYAQLGAETDLTNLYPSINNKEDIISFFMDLLNTIVGSVGLEQLIGELMTTFVDGLEPQLKEIVGNQFNSFNSGDGLPTDFVVNGVTVPAIDIDLFEKLKTSPQSEIGDLLYDLDVPNFDRSAFSAISVPNTEVGFNNITIKFDGTLDAFQFKPIVTDPPATIGEFFGTYIEDSPLLDKKEFLTNVMDSIYGSVSSNQDKSFDQLLKEQEIKKLIEQVTENNDAFFINDEIFQDLEKKAQELLDGVLYYDLGCGVIGADLPLSGMTDLISTISGMTDPFGVAQEVTLTISASTTGDAAESEENAETIKNGFFNKLIKAFTTQLAVSVMASPQMRMLLSLKSYFEEGEVKIGEFKDDIQSFKVNIKCIIDDIMSKMNEFIYYLIIGLLVAIIDPVIREVIREKINQYIGVIKSLVGI